MLSNEERSLGVNARLQVLLDNERFPGLSFLPKLNLCGHLNLEDKFMDSSKIYSETSEIHSMMLKITDTCSTL